MRSAAASFEDAVARHRSGDLAAAQSLYRALLAREPAHGDALFNLAALHARLGDHDEAAALYDRVLALRPGDPEVLSNLGNLRMAQGRHADAGALYAAALAADPFLAPAHMNLGHLAVQSGDLAAAERHYGEAVGLDPTLSQAYNNLGVVLHLGGRHDDAAEAFQRAVASDAQNEEALKNLGCMATAAGRLRDGEALLRAARELAPAHPGILVALGQNQEKQGRRADAIACFRAAIAADEGHADAWRQLGACLSLDDDGAALEALERADALAPGDPVIAFYRGLVFDRREDFQSAAQHFAAAAEAAPESAEILNSHGAALHNLGRHAEALEILQRALTAQPDYPEALNNLGNCLAKLNRIDEAAEAYERALELSPKLAIAAANLGNMLREAGRLRAAEAAFRRAIAIDSRLANAYNGLALVLQQLNLHEQAAAVFETAIAVNPEYPEALNNYAITLTELGRFVDAIEMYNRLLDLRPNLVEALFNLGTMLQYLGRWDESIAAFNEALRHREHHNIVYPYLVHSLMQQANWTNLEAVIARIRENTESELAQGQPVSISAFALQSLPGEFSMDLRRRVAEQISGRQAAYIADVTQRLSFPRRRTRANEKLTIGYVSPDFRFHSVAVAFKGILDNHDRDRFRLCGYGLHTGRGDHMTRYFADAFDVFRGIGETGFEEAARRIDQDGVDILIDLAGHTRGACFELFVLHPAPIQAHYLGYSATIGARYIEYLITDPHQVPPEARAHFTEQLVYLPETFMATQRAPIAVARPRRADCGLPADGLVFCNFNTHYKFEPRLFSIWMRLLRQVPGSVLWLIQGSQGSTRNLRREAAARSVDPDRLVFAERITHPEHLARHRLADLVLDTLYHGGGVTTVDALWVGVPVITLAGPTPQSRNGASLLAPMGMADLITTGVEDYERLALTLARDAAARAALRARLAANRDREPLFQPARLTRHLEDAYRRIWRNHADGNPPRLIEVPRLD